MQLAAEKGLVHAHARHLSRLNKIHEKVGDEIVVVMPEGEMGELIFPAEGEQTLAAQARTVKTGGVS